MGRDNKLSERIAFILNEIDDIKNEYAYCFDKEGELDLLTQDYLHQLEFVDLSRNERNKLLTGLKKCRAERRECKNEVMISREFVEFIKNHHQDIDKMKKILGNVRNKEQSLSVRTYVPRIMTEEEFNGIKGKMKLVK